MQISRTRDQETGRGASVVFVVTVVTADIGGDLHVLVVLCNEQRRNIAEVEAVSMRSGV